MPCSCVTGPSACSCSRGRLGHGSQRSTKRKCTKWRGEERRARETHVVRVVVSNLNLNPVVRVQLRVEALAGGMATQSGLDGGDGRIDLLLVLLEKAGAFLCLAPPPVLLDGQRRP